MEEKGTIYGINGPIITVKASGEFQMSEMARVGASYLIGEVIRIQKEHVIIQVFEETSGLRPGEAVYGTGKPISVLLGPGLMANIFDGIERPLETVAQESGVFIKRGLQIDQLDMAKKWHVTILVKAGEFLEPGMVFGEVQETPMIIHRLMVPPNTPGGSVCFVVPDGEYTLEDVLLRIQTENGTEYEVGMLQEWPIRSPRPVHQRLKASQPLITGQRIIDSLFPIAKGGMAALPGGFGTGKTMNQHQLAKWSNADIIVYIGCGERGNEMTQVLEEFSNLKDPRSGKRLLDRTILIANTSNMPVAAREASIYTGVTIAEYYRDMGYHVAILADSTSRWAEALRELSGRLEEMPAEEGFPAYLASRISCFYERAGYFYSLNGQEGSITIIGAVSPQGGDFSEPVTQNTKRFVRCFWTLDRSLAYARHFPAIHWLTSYSEYLDDLQEWYGENVSTSFMQYRADILRILQEESELMEIVKLIGADVLPDNQKLILEIAKIIRLGFLQQNAYHAYDTFVPFTKQVKMMELILYTFEKSKELVSYGIPIRQLKGESLYDDIIAIKYNVDNEHIEEINTYFEQVDQFFNKLKTCHPWEA